MSTREIDYAGLVVWGPVFSLVVGPLIASIVGFPGFVVLPLFYIFGFIPACLAGFVFSILFFLSTKVFPLLRNNHTAAILYAAALGAVTGYTIMRFQFGNKPIDWWNPVDMLRLGIGAGCLNAIAMVHWWYKKELRRTA